jgi:hypothetical protein
MGRLDNAFKERADAEARKRAQIRAGEEESEEELLFIEEQGRQLSEEFLNEVRTRQLEPVAD